MPMRHTVVLVGRIETTLQAVRPRKLLRAPRDVSLFSSASQVDRAIQKYQEDEDDESWASGLDLSGCNESDMTAYSRLIGYYRYMDEGESSL